MKLATAKSWIFDCITVVGFLLTALGTYLTLKSDVARDILEQSLAKIGFCIVVTAVLACYHYFHKAVLLESVLRGRDSVAGAINMILHFKNNPASIEHVQQGLHNMSEICQHISAAFRKYHAPDVAVCIHYLNVDENQRYYVNVLCRNTETKKRHTSAPPPAFDKDFLEENTDFNSLFPKLKTHKISEIYYLNNFLPYSPFYRNSHFSEEKQKSYYKLFGIFHRIFNWELPYKSTLVVPLITIQSERIRHLEGFLSIDSPKLWAFSLSYDLPIILTIAEAIAPIVKIYNQSNLLRDQKF